MPPAADAIARFRPRRPGPEVLIQDAVAAQIPELFSSSENLWTGTSVPIGAGMPDLVVVSYYPELLALANIELADASIFAYLRAVRKARLETIAERTGTCAKKLSDRLSSLVDAEAIEASCDTFALSPLWREILTEVITIEVKVSNWKKAIRQAARNRIFAHLSFVALPEPLARRIRTEPLLSGLGIGLISVSDSEGVAVIRKPRRSRTTVWTYYYRLASILAKSHSS
jgi:hypothetical protein